MVKYRLNASRFLVAVATLVFLGIGTSCGRFNVKSESTTNISRESRMGSSDSIDKPEIIDHIRMELCSGVVVDAKVITPEGFEGQASSYLASARINDIKDVCDSLGFNANDIVVTSGNVFQYGNINVSCGETINYTTEIGDKYAVYIDYDMYAGVTDVLADIPEIEGYGRDKSLPDVSMEEARAEAVTFLDKLGLNDVMETGIYALPVEYHMLDEADAVEIGMLSEDKALAEKWKEIGGCYQLEYVFCVDNIPLYKYGYVTTDDTAVDGGLIRLLVSRDGVQRAEIPTHFFITETFVLDTPLLTAEEILEHYKIKMENLIMPDDYIVTELSLCYFPKITDTVDRQYCIIPAWQITMKNSQNFEWSVLYDAANGDEIVW